MLSEKDMENAIAQNPKKYLGEDGLELIERQYPIGNYIFDLLFKDRHGAKLIVEIQKGTLDRNHTYKILDYYDGFKEKHPKEFIELMAVANHITAERKKRLHALGEEFREVPESEFISGIFVGETTSFQPSIIQSTKIDFGKNLAVIDNDAIKSYQLFKEQKNLFVENLLETDKNMSNDGIKGDWKKDLKPEYISKRKNWWIGFVPNSWGIFKKGWYGVHFGFMYHRNRNTQIEYVRFNISIEKPLKTEFHDQFKKDVVEHLKQQRVNLQGYAIWPDVGFRKAKLIEAKPLITLDYNSWEKVLNKYLELKKRNCVQVIAEVIKQYYNHGCFNTYIDFPE